MYRRPVRRHITDDRMSSFCAGVRYPCIYFTNRNYTIQQKLKVVKETNSTKNGGSSEQSTPSKTDCATGSPGSGGIVAVVIFLELSIYEVLISTQIQFGPFLAEQSRSARGENFNKQGSTAVFVPVHDNKWRPWVEELRTFFKPWRNCWVQALEILIEKGIIGSQSFALIAVAGSLVGSILCFVEGCFLVLKSSTEYFRFASARIDQALIVKLLVEAIDMFLIGSALLTFGMALYVMFVGTSESQQSGSHTSESKFGLFNLKKLKQGVKKQSVAQAKTKVGQAVVLLLQAGVMEKFTDVPLASCADLACFAGAVLASSASVFLLSRLKIPQNQK